MTLPDRIAQLQQETDDLREILFLRLVDAWSQGDTGVPVDVCEVGRALHLSEAEALRLADELREDGFLRCTDRRRDPGGMEVQLTDVGLRAAHGGRS